MADTPEGAMTESGPADPLIGRVFGERFVVVGLIARGGMGRVYRAEQRPLGRQVALKVLLPNPALEEEEAEQFHERFLLEASIVSKLTHPNTVTLFDYGQTEDDYHYIAMELLEGRTVRQALDEDGPFSGARAMHVAMQICRSVREAHALGVIHRDLKPANVLLVQHGDQQDVVKVLDFGLVKNVATHETGPTLKGAFLGSPKYMAPEQIRSEPLDGRTDIYALGVLLYEMLTGQVPFGGPSAVDILLAHVNEPPTPLRERRPDLDAPRDLDEIVMKTLAKEPAERFESMDALLASLKDLARDTGLDTTGAIGSAGNTGRFAVPATPPPGGRNR